MTDVRTIRRRAAVAALALTASATLLLATPAVAAGPIPEGTIFSTGWYQGQLYTVSPTAGDLTAVGAFSGINWSSGLDIDGTTGTGYAVSYTTDPETEGGLEGPAKLYSVDATTGVLGLIATLTVGGVPVKNCLDLDYSAARILVLCDSVNLDSWVGEVDPATGATTILVEGLPRSTTIAQKPNGPLYALGFEREVSRIDLGAHSFEPVGVISTPGIYPEGGDFDAAGTLWISSRGEMSASNLATLDPELLTGAIIAPMELNGADAGVGNDISVTGPLPAPPVEPTPAPETVVPVPPAPTPALANTGLDATPAALGGLAILAGIAALGVSIRRRLV